MEIKDRIKLLRKDLHLTQTAFASKLFLTMDSISLIERGINNPASRTIEQICEVFNVRKEWLLTGEGEMYDLPENEDIKMLMQFVKHDDLPANILKAAIKYYLMLDDAGRDLLEERIDEAIKKSRK